MDALTTESILPGEEQLNGILIVNIEGISASLVRPLSETNVGHIADLIHRIIVILPSPKPV